MEPQSQEALEDDVIGVMEVEVEKLRQELAAVEAERAQVMKRMADGPAEALRAINWKWIYQATKFSGWVTRTGFPLIESLSIQLI